MMIKWYRRRRTQRQLDEVQRQLAAMSALQASEVLKTLIGTDQDRAVDGAILALIADRAADGAEGASRTVLERVAKIYREGRTVKFGTFPASFSTVVVSDELRAEVESAFAGGKENGR